MGEETVNQQQQAGATGDNPAGTNPTQGSGVSPSDTSKPSGTTGQPADGKQESKEPDWLEGRLRRAEESAVNSFAKELGYDNAEAIKTALASVGNAQGLSNQLQQLQDKVKVISTELNAVLQSEIDSVPEEHRQRLTDALTAVGDDPIVRMKIVRTLKPSFAHAQQQEAPPEKRQPEDIDATKGGTGKGKQTPSEADKKAIAARFGIG